MGETYHRRYCPICEKHTGWMCGGSGWGNNCACESCGTYFRRDGSATKWPPMYMFEKPEDRMGVILAEGYMGTLNHRGYHFWGDRAINKLRLYEPKEMVE